MAESDTNLTILDTTGHLVPVWTDAREQLIRSNFVPKNAPNDMVEAFLALARHRGLAPEEKHIYLIQRGQDWVVQTGIDGFRLIADRTGTYAGSDPAVYTYNPDGTVESATVTVWKMVQGQRCPFGATAFVADYSTKKLLWASMPRVMAAKVAESAALRKAFPAQLAGIYEGSEMDQADAAPGAIRETPQRLTGSVTPARDAGPIVDDQRPWSERIEAALAMDNGRRKAAFELLLAEAKHNGDEAQLAALVSAATTIEAARAVANAAGKVGKRGELVEAALAAREAMVEAEVETATRAAVGVNPHVEEYDPDTGERIPDWVGQDVVRGPIPEGPIEVHRRRVEANAATVADGLPGMPAPKRGRTAEQIAGIN